MRPLQYDLQCPAAKDNTITHAAAAPSHLDAAIALRYRHIELLNTLELRTSGVRNCSSKTGSQRQSKTNTILKHFLKMNSKRKTTSAKIEKIC